MRTPAFVTFLLAALLGVGLPGAPAAAQSNGPPRVAAQVSDRQVYAGQPFRLNIAIENVEDPPAPDITSLEQRFEVESLGRSDFSSRSVSIINGRRTETAQHQFVHQYRLTALAPGAVRIPPVVVTIDGREYTSQPIDIRVIAPQETENIKLRMAVSDRAPFVGEPVELTLTWYVGANVSGDFGFSLPLPRGAFDVYNSPQARPSQRQIQQAQFIRLNFLGQETYARRGQGSLDGRLFTTLTIRKLLVPRQTGALTLGPALVNCEVEIGRRRRGLLGSEAVVDAVVAPSNEVSINVRPLPEEGRPAAFSGVVGSLRVGASASPREVNVGDPIELEIRLTASPPVERLERPDLRRVDGFTERFRLSDDPPEIEHDGRVMTVTTLVRALNDAVEQVPAIEIPYFDPSTERYITARSEPIPLTVRPTEVVTLGDAVGAVGPAAGEAIEARRGGLAANFTGDAALVDQSVDWGATLRSPLTIGLAAGPPALYLGAALVAVMRRRAEKQAPIRRARGALGQALRSLRGVSGEIGGEAAGDVSAAVRGYVAARFGKAAPSLTPDECERLLTERGVDEAGAVRTLLERCDAARFAGAGESASALAGEAEALLRQVDRRLGRRG